MAASLFKWLIAGVLFTYSGNFGPVNASTMPTPSAETHPLYITVTEINHNAKDKTLEISCKIFTNDFETVLEKQAGSKVDLSDAAAKNASAKCIKEYISRHLLIKVDGKPVTLQLIGSERQEDGTWSYFQVGDVATVKRLDIVNNLLYDGFTQEMNIMHVTVGGVRKSSRLNYPDTAADFEF